MFGGRVNDLVMLGKLALRTVWSWCTDLQPAWPSGDPSPVRWKNDGSGVGAVSYTHLTLPTILRV